MRQDQAEVFDAILETVTPGRVYYMTTPITSGRHEYELAAAHGSRTIAEFRREHHSLWVEQIVQANEKNAREFEQRLRDHCSDTWDVINPARTSVPNWEQRCYDELWAAVIRRLRPTMAPAPGWAYSRGSREEILLALDLGLRFVSLDGTARTSADIETEMNSADAELATRRWVELLRLPTRSSSNHNDSALLV